MEMVKLLAERGADINTKAKASTTVILAGGGALNLTCTGEDEERGKLQGTRTRTICVIITSPSFYLSIPRGQHYCHGSVSE